MSGQTIDDTRMFYGRQLSLVNFPTSTKAVFLIDSFQQVDSWDNYYQSSFSSVAAIRAEKIHIVSLEQKDENGS